MDIIEARQKVHQRGLAAPRRSHHGHHLALADGEVDVAQHLALLRCVHIAVGEGDILEFYFVAQLLHRQRVLALQYLLVGVDDLIDAGGGRHSALQGVVGGHQSLGRHYQSGKDHKEEHKQGALAQ